MHDPISVSVLLVDDESVVRQGLSDQITNLGLPVSRIQQAANGEEALNHLRAESFDLILVDINMPRIDGLEFCRLASGKLDSCHLCIVSGIEDFDYAREAICYGVNEYVLKPVKDINLIKIFRKFHAENEAITADTIFLDRSISLYVRGIWETDPKSLETGHHLTKSLFDRCAISYALALLEIIVKQVSAELEKRLSHSLSHVGIAKELRKKGDAWQDFVSIVERLNKRVFSMRRDNKESAIEAAKAYIEAHYSEEVSLDVLSEHVYLSPNYLSQVFKEKTGETFVHFKMKIRVQKAKNILENPEYSITDVAQLTGFKDTPHFTKVFKRFTGTTPHEYRKGQIEMQKRRL